MKNKLYINSKKIPFYFFVFSIFNQLIGGEISQISSYETWNADPRIIPSTDPAGIAWNSQNWHFFIVDSEISEEEQWNDENIFETNTTGSILYYTYITRPDIPPDTNREPTGICYYPGEGFYYVVNDDSDRLYQYVINSGTINLIQSWKVDISPFSIDDPEGITVNPDNGHLYIADGRDGANQVVAIQVVGSSLVLIPSESFSVDVQDDAEGIAYRPSTGTLFIVSSQQGGTIFEWDINNGTLIDTYSLSSFSPEPISPQGLTFGPRSTNNSYESLYISDGGFDNTSDPFPLYNDGVIYEAKIGIDDTSLPVELASFTADIFENNVLLEWITESEIDNIGFELRRADKENGEYIFITSYKDNIDLWSQGNSSIRHEYSYTDELVEPGKTYWYMLADWDIYGIKTFHGPVSVTVHEEIVSPVAFKLHSNYPNPFNPTTNIKIEIPILNSGTFDTKLVIYNNLGQLVKTLYQERLSPGIYEVQWDGTTDIGDQVPAGVYFAHLNVGPYSQSIRMILLK